MIRAKAFAKLTLSLRVSAPVESGLHPVDGLFQSVDWCDDLSIDSAEADGIASSSGADVVDAFGNLAWRAAAAVRQRAVAQPPLSLTLDKSLPVASGVGGGSADAAAALGIAAMFLGVDRGELVEIAPTLGSDVPFCLIGGSARVSGVGEQLDPRSPQTGFAVAMVVPPVEVSTPAVYRAWDALDGPAGTPVAAHDAPPQLRDEALANDLYAAAVAVAPEIEDWRSELAARWGRSVALAGSGPTLFAFFVDNAEASAALDSIPVGARAAQAASPVDHGWIAWPAGGDRAIDSKGRTHPGVDW